MSVSKIPYQITCTHISSACVWLAEACAARRRGRSHSRIRYRGFCSVHSCCLGFDFVNAPLCQSTQMMVEATANGSKQEKRWVHREGGNPDGLPPWHPAEGYCGCDGLALQVFPIREFTFRWLGIWLFQKACSGGIACNDVDSANSDLVLLLRRQVKVCLQTLASPTYFIYKLIKRENKGY